MLKRETAVTENVTANGVASDGGRENWRLMWFRYGLERKTGDLVGTVSI